MRAAGWGASLAILVAVAAGCSILSPGSGQDKRRFDDVEAAFDADPSAFTAAAAHLDELRTENPGAQEVSWGLGVTYVADADGRDIWGDATPAEAQLFDPLPGTTNTVFAYAKDPGRVFFSFNHEDPPMVYLMYAPDDSDPGAFAAERGFRSSRVIGDGWTLLGEIDDRDRRMEQFPLGT